MPFDQAIEQLRDRLAQIADTVPGMRQICVNFSPDTDALNWLASQRCWPQFYWQSRCGEQSVAACGAVERYYSMAQATRRLGQLPSGWRLFGANSIDGDSYLFLPVLLWQQDSDGQRLILNLISDISVQQEAKRLLRWLDELRPMEPAAQLPHYQRAHHAPDKDGWLQQVNQALKAITGGELDKVVLARVTDFSLSGPLSPAALLAASQRINPRCYHFMLATEPQQALVGSSPERLYARRGREMDTEALAGTADLDQPGLLDDAKNQWENSLVVADIHQRLTDIVDEMAVMPVELVPLRHLQHLRRRISARLLQADDAQCVARLQPTAAVGGLPRAAALDFIHQHEPFARGWYSGSVGYLSQDESEFNVVLRCAQTGGEQIRLYAGAGIVSGSDPELEWQEVERKAATLGTLLTAENQG
ncbi:isochorismate synthase [Erwinia sorbitola]|uniref:isochorismate synthase n=1 Tax=Erwinia sorbitola TaxID=2681984 RepID=A0A6I6EJT6_9GAMM|nr:isochorismate synthase [Erwinia sorbitola]QGU86871.1 isochorismate synthase [Erwinia sorbitola]